MAASLRILTFLQVNEVSSRRAREAPPKEYPPSSHRPPLVSLPRMEFLSYGELVPIYRLSRNSQASKLEVYATYIAPLVTIIE